MRDLIKAHPVVSALVCLSVLLRVGMYVFQQDAAGDDGCRYLLEAQQLVEFQVFSNEPAVGGLPPNPTAHDLPFWPFLMAFYLWVTGSVQAMIYLAGLTNLVLFTAGLLMLIYILRHKPFCADDAGLAWAVGIFSFIPGTIVYSLFYMPDQLCVTMLLGGVLFFFKGLYGHRKHLFVSALFWGLSILAKPICIPLSIAYFLMLLVVLKESWRRRILYVAGCLLVVFCVLTPWIIRNKVTFDVWGITTISQSNVYTCNWRWMVYSWKQDKREAALEQDRQFKAELAKGDYNVMQAAGRVGSYARGQILAHLPEYLWFTVKSHPWLYAGTGIKAFFGYFKIEGFQDIKNVYPRKSFWDVVKPWLTANIWGPLSVLWLLVGYVVMFVGFCRRSRQLCRLPEDADAEQRGWFRLSFACAMCTLILLAAVIGPVTATRYRFVMNPFFAMLASFIGGVTYTMKEPKSQEQTVDEEGEQAATAEAALNESKTETADT